MQHLVKPHWGLAENVGMLPRFPGEIGLRLASDESPIDAADPLFLGNRQDRVKRAAHRTGHEFRADDGAVALLQANHFALGILPPTVVMKGDAVGFVPM